jgi:putative hydrolase of the HAD superfamily
MTIKTIAFDGDDTLWHHQNYFEGMIKRFNDAMNRFGHYPDAGKLVDVNHIADLKLWGYGVKGFTLTMIETAIKMTDGKITGDQLYEIFNIGKEAYLHPVRLLDHVRETVATLHGKYFLLVITKGDLMAQEMKIAQSGLASLFDGIEIVSEKDERTYERIFKRYAIDPAEFVMVGNTIRSDILPPLHLGAHAIHIPYHTSWHFETPEIAEADKGRFTVLPSMEKLPEVIANLTV